MRKPSLLYTAFGLMSVFLILDLTAHIFSFYWIYWWYDIMMHILAGFSGGMVIVWFFTPTNIYKSLFLTIACLLIVGIAWEIFEYAYNFTQPLNYRLDTIFDLINDILGAALASFYANERIRGLS